MCLPLPSSLQGPRCSRRSCVRHGLGSWWLQVAKRWMFLPCHWRCGAWDQRSVEKFFKARRDPKGLVLKEWMVGNFYEER